MHHKKLMVLVIGLFVMTSLITACNMPMPPQPEMEPDQESEPAIAEQEQMFLWDDVTAETIGVAEGWTNKVELADITGDGLVDILFANGSEYNVPGTPEISNVFVNQGAGEMFEEVGEAVFGSEGMLARVIKARDVNDDGHVDIMVGTTYETQSRLFIGDASGNFTDVTDTQLPQIDASVGDLEFGDVDGDGDLDAVLADWGPGDPWRYASDSNYREGNGNDYYPCSDLPWGQLSYDAEGGRTMLWLNDGAGNFTDVTADQMPESLVLWSWDLEFVDIDNDYDLDILVSCKMCDGGGFIFENDGTGLFTDITVGNMPRFMNNYEYEAIDLNGDDYLDLITANDDPQEGCDDDLFFTEHVFLNTTEGGFVNATDELWPLDQQVGIDDNQSLYLDYDSDGDADVLTGALILPLPGFTVDYDRIMENDGSGHLTMKLDLFGGEATSGTLGIAVADLNGDHKLDVVQGQGEFASDNRVFFGTNIAPDTAAPIITLVEKIDDTDAGQILVRARIHDNKSPTMPHDWQSVVLRWDDGESPMKWYGEYLWHVTIDASSTENPNYQVCAIDAAGNEACEPL